MVNISQAIKALNLVKGSKASMTIGTRALRTAARQKDATGKLSELLSKYPNANLQVSAKASEQGFTVGAFSLRNGKEVLGNGAISIYGAGTQAPVLKTRLNFGKNGNILSYRAHNNLGHNPRIQDISMTSSIKDGVIETSASAGKYAGQHLRLDVPKAVESIGMTAEGQEFINGYNHLLSEANNVTKNLFAGKEVNVDKAWMRRVCEDSGLLDLFTRMV